MSLSKEDLDRVVKLAHITIRPEKEAMYLSQLQDILNQMDELEKLDLTDIEPSSYAIEQAQYLRPDEVKKFEDFKLAQNAPKWQDDSFNVPQILKR
tara:strand:- start:202 stop:489 length:288 start_codon:yes stop_codon:yes gene_type:complete